MSNKPNNFTNQRKMKWFFGKCNWATLLFTLNILFSDRVFGNSGDLMTVNLGLTAPGRNGELALECNLIESNEDAQIQTYDPILCKNATIDDIITYKDENYVFKGDKYWKQVNHKLVEGYPKLISERWPGAPSDIDAAFVDTPERYIYFFKGSQCWKFKGEKLEEKYPKEIREAFPGLPNDIQAATIMSPSEDLFVYKGDRFYIYEISSSNPKPANNKALALWIGIPEDVDGVLNDPLEVVSYFFKGDKYYKYDGASDQLAVEDIPYPRRVASNWFGCPKAVRIIEE